MVEVVCAPGHSVAIVVDRRFGDRLLELAERLHVWVCASPENQRVVEDYRRRSPDTSLERGFTTFDAADSDPPEALLVGILGTVDLHHGEHSHAPPWDTLEVHGTSATPAVRQALAGFGVEEVVPVPGGFRCSRRA